MAESLVREILVGSATWEQDGCEISISEQQISVFEGQFRSAEQLDQFCHLMMQRTVGTGEMAAVGNMLLLRYSPFSAYIISRLLNLEDFNAEHRVSLTDVSHGKCALFVQGDSILNLFGEYCSTDLCGGRDRDYGMVKTRFIDYELTIWWNSNDEINLMINRSYALSFVDILHLLFIRR